MGDLFVHYGTVQKGSFAVGDNVNLEINIQKETMQEQITLQHIYFTSL